MLICNEIYHIKFTSEDKQKIINLNYKEEFMVKEENSKFREIKNKKVDLQCSKPTNKILI